MSKKRHKNITTPKAKDRKEERFTSIVILGDNYGYRMKSYGPLPLVEIQNKTLLEHQLESIRAVYADYEVILCCGFQSDRVYKFVKKNLSEENIRIVENQVYEFSNTAESARIGINNTMNDSIVIIDGSLALTPTSLSSIKRHENCVLTQSKKRDDNFENQIKQPYKQPQIN